MSTHPDQRTPADRAFMDAARAWCADVFSDYEDDASDYDVLACLLSQYHSGFPRFALDNGLDVYPWMRTWIRV